MIEKVFAVCDNPAGGVDLGCLAPNPTVTSFGSLISGLVKDAFILAGTISFVLLLYGGFQVIVAAGDAKKMEQGRAAITGAVVGLLVVLGSFWIIQVIEVITGLHILSPPV